MKRAATLILLTFTLLGCNSAWTEDVPAPYFDQIAKLRDANIELAKKCQDLAKQQADLAAEQNWNSSRINLFAGQALAKLGKSNSEYKVNIDKMTVEKIPASKAEVEGWICPSQAECRQQSDPYVIPQAIRN